MFTLLSEIHFWTIQDNIQSQDSDLGAFRYHDKRVVSSSILNASKRQYTESRGVNWFISNKRPHKLRDCLKELEDLLEHLKLVHQEWCNSLQLQLLFHSGILVTISIDPHTADITHIQIDKYLVNKLLVDNLSHVIITNQHALCCYNENQLTLVNFHKPTLKSVPSKWHHLDPKLFHLNLSGPTGRRIERKMSANVSGDLMLSWWRCTRDEVYPWTPVVKDVDRANIHIYSLNGSKLELLCYYKTESDPMCVEFSHIRPNIVYSVEQKVSRRGEVSVETSTFEILNAKCTRIAATCIPLETNVCCHAFSPDNRHLLLGCIDGSLVLHDIAKGITHLVKSAFIPTLLCWNSYGCIFTAANEKCQLQFFDSALSCIKVQLNSEDITPCNILDLGSYFKTQPTLLDIRWHQRPSQHTSPSDFTQTDALLFLSCEKGPLCVLKILGVAQLTASSLISQYMTFHHTDQAVSLLRSLDWKLTPAMCLKSLQSIVNTLLSRSLTPEVEVQLENSLASFLAPVRGFSASVELEYGDSVQDLARRFLYCLLRHGIIGKALQVAVDLEEADVLMDVHHAARALGHLDVASAALEHAMDLTGSESSSCSCASSSNESNESFVLSSLPPLPKPKVKFSDTVTRIQVSTAPTAGLHIQGSAADTVSPHIQGSTTPTASPQVPSASSHLNGNLGIPLVPSSSRGSSNAPTPNHVVYQTPPKMKFDEEESKKIKVVHFGVV